MCDFIAAFLTPGFPGFASFALEFIYKLYLSSRLLLLASQRCRFLFVDISDVHHCYVAPIVTFRTSADVCSYGQTFCFVYVHGFHYAFELLSRLVFVFLYDIIRGYRILLVQAECSIIKLSFPFPQACTKISKPDCNLRVMRTPTRYAISQTHQQESKMAFIGEPCSNISSGNHFTF